MIGLDTSAIIDLFKGEEKIREVLEAHKEPVAATILSYLELFLDWILKMKSTRKKRSIIGIFKQVYSLDLTKNLVRRHLKFLGV